MGRSPADPTIAVWAVGFLLQDAAILHILLWISIVITSSCDVRHIRMFALEFNVPTDILWGELGAENADLERAVFIFTGLRSVTSEFFFSFYFLPRERVQKPAVRCLWFSRCSESRFGLRPVWASKGESCRVPSMRS